MNYVDLRRSHRRYFVVYRWPVPCRRLANMDRKARETMREQPAFGNRGQFRRLSASITNPPTTTVECEQGRAEESASSGFVARGTRLFRLTWDNSKVRTRDPHKHDRRVAIGCHFATGRVALDNGNMFDTFGEMEHMLGLHGRYEIEWEAR